MDSVLSFTLVGCALLASPGPATLSMGATGAAFGLRRGLGYLTGLVAGLLGVMLITASGLSSLLLALPGVAPVIGGLSLLYMLFLAYRIASAPPLSLSSDESHPPRLMSGIFLSLTNPKAYAAMAALFSGYTLVVGALELDLLAKIGILLLVALSSDFAWLILGSSLANLSKRPGISRGINIGFAIALLLSIGLALLL
ncbi:LysE family translocator [Dongshaea marina]|uniref:LysE family translocator n=1 Tax=Dongshaea marina TaxID=2047966 RepID=UPI000D3EAD31|nr:LysE family transporter [Dongshaea marina]